MKTNHSKEKKIINKIILIFRILSIIIIIYCLLYIFNWYLENKKNKEIFQEITSNNILDTIVIEIPETTDSTNNSTNAKPTEPSKPTQTTQVVTYTFDFKNLLSINDSTIGWIYVPGTNINYPVVQANDNDFYLKHSFNKTKNSAGWIFADYRNKLDGTDKNIIIYGHNRMDSSMFATLRNTQKQNWATNKNNHYITFSTPDGNTHIYQVFSTYTIKSETYYLTTIFQNDDTYLDFLNTLKNRSSYNFNVNLSKEDSILTLSTCDSSGKSRVIVHAKKIK